MYRVMSLGMKEHYAYKKKVRFDNPALGDLREGMSEMLTDGVRGSNEYDHSWANFYGGKDVELVIDLGEVRDIRRIEAGFLQFGYWLKLFPKQVEFFTSQDGARYETAGSMQNTLPITQYGNQQRDFYTVFDLRKARYVKLKAESIGNTPSWHPGNGRPSIICIDEIVVE
jgi:hypothetical protein